MYTYDFQILQPIEFEDLTRDLLQKKEGAFIESFTMGRDGGIDLRFAQARGTTGVVVQAKRVKDFRTLIQKLRSEVDKVQRLNPDRYIISTSVGLTPDNKEKIQQLFTPFILSTEDILGRDELNNLLSQYPEIEKKYYKLWLGSSTVLESILNKRIENWSTMELEETRKTVSLYVMNDSFLSAEKILKENRYIIISGIPGIGKTTLARMLVYNLLANAGYEEFIKVNSMDDAAQKLTPGKKQIFMYDDFLGHSFLENKEAGFENKVLAFIEKVKREPDKLFILSTREYILSSAKRQFESFSIKNIELAKCTLDLSYYSESIKASILYNHLAMSSLPTEYIYSLLRGRQYLKLVKHKNFNPRIIEAFLNDKLYLKETPQGFVNRFLDFFDRPLSVWEFAFSNMSSLAQSALIVRATMGSDSVYLADWLQATEFYMKGKDNNPLFSIEETEWNNTIKDLLGTFIATSPNEGDHLVDFNNPSVFDFLVDYIRQRKKLQHSLIQHAYFSNQITELFTDRRGLNTDNYGLITVSEDFYPLLENAFKIHLSHPISYKVSKVGSMIYKERYNVVKFLLELFGSFPVMLRNNPQIYAEIVTTDLLANKAIPLYARMELLDKLDLHLCSIDLNVLTDSVLSDIQWTHEFKDVLSLLGKTTKGRAILEDQTFVKRIESVMEEELEQATGEGECMMIKDSLEILSEKIPGLDYDTWSIAIDEAASSFASPEPEYDDWAPSERYSYSASSNGEYYDMFSSLLEQ